MTLQTAVIRPLFLNALAGAVVILSVLMIPVRTSGQVSAKFNFSAGSTSVSGWTNVAGDPATAVRTATDPSGISISSIATANWAPLNSSSAFDGLGASGGTFFPAAVMLNHWFQYSGTLANYNAAIPQLLISGLNKDSLYTVKMAGSSTSSSNTNPTRYTVAGLNVSGFIDVNNHNNTANGATFINVAPDAAGTIRVYVNTVPTTDVADISGLQIIRGATVTPTPVVAFSAPHNNDIVPEDGNLVLKATATETGGTISKVQFYRDTLLLGEALSAPYTFTWVAPDPGSYTLIAKALDNQGVSATSTVHVTVESLNYFWSTTGNIATGGDTSFVGTVDSNRLAFRTKNLERMSILPTGNIGIGTKTPSAQLHTTGSVRLAGLTNDSTKTRIVVSDTSGNLYYRNAATLGGAGGWMTVGNTGTNPASNFIGTTDAQRLVFKTNGVETMTILTNGSVGIGTPSMPAGDAKLAVKGTIYAQKVRVTPSGWADYVFKKDYHLPSLAQVERYINEHQHLQGMIPASDVEKRGVDIGDNQVMLLKKIEELTLYLIQQNKRAEEQQKLLQQQQEKIDRLEKLVHQMAPSGKSSTN